MRRATALLAALIALALAPGTAGAEQAVPAWSITSARAPSVFRPGDDSGEAAFLVELTNVGSAPSDGSAVTITDELPAGLTPHPGPIQIEGFPLTCGVAGRTVSCEGAPSVPPGGVISIAVPVDVDSGAAGTLSNLVSVGGGGAGFITAAESVPLGGAPAPFGIQAFDGFLGSADGSADAQAGSHPFDYTTRIEFTSTSDAAGATRPAASPKDLEVALPPGLIGNPTAVPQCTYPELKAGTREAAEGCPVASQVGMVSLRESTFLSPDTIEGIVPVYNMVPPPGHPAELAFQISEVVVPIDPELRSGSDYGITAHLRDVSAALPVIGSTLTLWGVPAEAAHDAQRCPLPGLASGICEGGGAERAPRPAGVSPAPFLTLPGACAGPSQTTLSVDSWQEPGTAPTAAYADHDAFGSPLPIGGCNRPGFEPSLSIGPPALQADSPTPLSVGIEIPQDEAPAGIASATLREAVLHLPPGLVVDPSSATGLVACNPAQIGLLTATGVSPAGFTADPPSCPAASDLGQVTVRTPLIDHPLPGALYLATQTNNPFGTLLALYLVVEDPRSGVLVKLAGGVDPDPQSGRLSVAFPSDPQLPFEDLQVALPGGPRASLRAPPLCGTYASRTELVPWTSPEGAAAAPGSSFAVTASPPGGCPPSEAAMPAQPIFQAGTDSPIAGSYSPFVLHLSREDGSQQLASLETLLPEGLLARLAGTPYCPEAAIAALSSRQAPGDGAAEQTHPACPAASQVGTVSAAAGAGPEPLVVPGRVYLAGPYEGAPISLVAVTPALAGPFDLGVVVVRVAVHVDPLTTRARAVSDPLPRILDGIPLDLRSIDLDLDKSRFTLDPTSCAEQQVSAQVTTTTGAVADVADPFRVGACGALAFGPDLKLTLSGKTRRAGFPSLRAVLIQPKGQDANIARTSVTLPRGMLVANGHISDPCTRVQFSEGAVPGERCPPGSILGSARVWTPLLDSPEEGKVYFRSNGGERELPDLVVALRGQIPVQLVGFIDSVGRAHAEVRRVRTRFQALPDAPVSRFELRLFGGRRGLLQNSTNLCRRLGPATYQLTGQNGLAHDTEAKVHVACGSARHKGSGSRHPRPGP